MPITQTLVGSRGKMGVSQSDTASYAWGLGVGPATGPSSGMVPPAPAFNWNPSVNPSLILTAGSGVQTYTGATTKTFSDWESILRTALAGEPRFSGARRVRNYAPSNGTTASSELFGAMYIGSNLTMVDGLTPPTGYSRASTLTATAGNAELYHVSGNPVSAGKFSICLRRITGTGIVRVSGDGGWTVTDITASLTTAWKRFAVASDGVHQIGGDIQVVTSGDQIGVTGWMVEDVTGQSNTNPSEYVSVGVEAAPYHGAGVDGVKYLPYENGCTVDPTTHVVTEAVGAPIAGIKWLGEGARTQYLGVTDAPATQTTASLGTGTYTLWVVGAGSATSSAGTATITGDGAATAGSPNTFTVDVAGTVVVTVAGALTRFQLELGAFPSQYIANAGAAGTAVTRNADVAAVSQTAGNIAAAQGTVYRTFTPTHAPSGTIALWGTYVDASNYTALLHDATNIILRKRIGGVNYDATKALAFAAGTTYKITGRWGAGGVSVFVDGVKGTDHADVTAAQIGTTMQWGADGNSAQQDFAGLGVAETWLTALTDQQIGGF